jgi:hypothetical protein
MNRWLLLPAAVGFLQCLVFPAGRVEKKPTLETINPADFVDPRFLRKLGEKGFFENRHLSRRRYP